MVEFILGMFASEEKVQVILENPLIELIFIVLFISFFLTVFAHFFLFSRLRKIRNDLRDTNRMDIQPLSSMKNEFEHKQKTECIKVETFVQEKFSNWRVVEITAVSVINMINIKVSVFNLLGFFR